MPSGNQSYAWCDDSEAGMSGAPGSKTGRWCLLEHGKVAPNSRKKRKNGNVSGLKAIKSKANVSVWIMSPWEKSRSLIIHLNIQMW